MESFQIKSFVGINTSDESSDVNASWLAGLENAIVRPKGAIQRVPKLKSLWGLPLLENLGLGGSGVIVAEIKNLINAPGIPNTVVGRVLVAFDKVQNMALGVFWLGDNNGEVSKFSNLESNYFALQTNALISNLAPNKRVYFYRIYNEIWIGNGVDPNMIYSPQRGLRLAGTNAKPLRPFVAQVTAPVAAPAVQATLSIPLADCTLTLTADETNFAGVAGGNISILIVNSGGSGPITSTRVGSGSISSPFIYTLTIGSDVANSSGGAISSYIAGDLLAQSLFSATLSGTGAVDNAAFTMSLTPFAGGADEVVDGVFPSTFRCRVVSCLYDPGTNEYSAYEGPMSPLSTELSTIGNDDILITVAAASGGGARFTHQTIWFRVYKGPTWPIDPNGPFEWIRVLTVPNANGSYRIRHNFISQIVQKEAPNQGVIPPCTMFEIADGRIWASGNASQPERIWISKRGNNDENVPEGCDLNSFIDAEGRKEEASRPVVTAIVRNEGRVQVHTMRSITMFDSASLKRIATRSDVGALNPACVATWNNATIPYFGSDGSIYKLVNTQFYRSERVASEAISVIREPEMLYRLTASAQGATLLADSANSLLFCFMPSVDELAANFFIIDTTSWAMSGPCQYPKIISISSTGSTDNRFILLSEKGGLFILDLNSINNIESIPVGEVSYNIVGDPFAPINPSLPLPSHFLKLPPAFLGENVIMGGYTLLAKTQWLNMGLPSTRKGFYSLDWSVARNSNGVIAVIIASDNGSVHSVLYGNVYGRDRHKIGFCLSGNAVQVKFICFSDQDAPFALRDMTIGWENQANAEMPFMF